MFSLPARRFFLLVVFAAVLTSLVSAQPQRAGGPEAAIRQLFLAIYGNDIAAYNRVTTDHPLRGRLTTGGSVNADRLRRLREDPEGPQTQAMRPLMYRGKPLGDGETPMVGTTAFYMASDQGSPLAVPLVLTAAGWKVDVRWWIAMSEMERSSVPPTGPEIAIRSLLAAMLRLDRNRASGYISDVRHLDLLFAGAPRSREPSGVLDATVGEMPLVEIGAGEFYAAPSGRVIEGGSTEDRKILVGLFGPVEMPFVVRRVGNNWRVEAEPYFVLMMQ